MANINVKVTETITQLGSFYECKIELDNNDWLTKDGLMIYLGDTLMINVPYNNGYSWSGRLSPGYFGEIGFQATGKNIGTKNPTTNITLEGNHFYDPHLTIRYKKNKDNITSLLGVVSLVKLDPLAKPSPEKFSQDHLTGTFEYLVPVA